MNKINLKNIKRNCSRITLISVCSFAMLATNNAYASNISALDKEIMEAKGFNYEKDILKQYDASTDYKYNPPLSAEEVRDIDDWCKWAYEESGAAKQKSVRDKVIYASIFLKSNYAYDYESPYESKEFFESSQLRSLPYKNTGACIGFSNILTRMLNIADIEAYTTLANLEGELHSVVRVMINKQWYTVEATGYEVPFNFYDYTDDKQFLDNWTFIDDYSTLVFDKDYLMNDYGTEYNIYVNTAIENRLSKGQVVIFGH